MRNRGFASQRRQTYPAPALALTELGGANAVVVDPTDGALVGVGDPRRQGVAVAARAAPPASGPAPTLPACWRDLYFTPPAPTNESPRSHR